jgi:hypothetical protein
VTYREIVHTCSHVEVARAAVDSIGGEIARRVTAEASRRKVSRGAFVAEIVRKFAASADEMDLANVSAATRNSDVPVLSGLRYILEREIDNGPPAWLINACAKAG